MSQQPDLHTRIENLLRRNEALQRAKAEATDDSRGFWKDPRTIFGILLTCVFSAAWVVASWNIRDSAYEAGRRSVYEPACISSCERRNSTIDNLRAIRDTYTCYCEDGSRLLPVQSRLFTNFE